MINPHLSDENLVLSLDNEASSAVLAHLKTCSACRERARRLENSLEKFVDIRDAQTLPPADFARAALRARLKHDSETSPLWRKLAMAAAGVALVIALIPTLLERTASAGARPRAAITPGEVRPISLVEVCRSRDAEVVVQDIPRETQNAVFTAYGMKPDSGKFEVDYLITPDLGGADSVRNMWPQPYSTIWNARLKDKLEQRLHQMVCNGQMDLPTAQRELAADWIGAYRKYLGR
jgi:hypothetical protein